MKQLLAALVVSGALVLALAAPAAGKGNGMAQADVLARGWMCFPGELMTHCVHPNTDIGALLAGALPSVPSLNFVNGRFAGTELLIRADLGDETRPCPQGTEPDGTYEAPEELDFDGDGDADYYSCHHNNDV